MAQRNQFWTAATGTICRRRDQAAEGERGGREGGGGGRGAAVGGGSETGHMDDLWGVQGSAPPPQSSHLFWAGGDWQLNQQTKPTAWLPCEREGEDTTLLSRLESGQVSLLGPHLAQRGSS